MSMLIFSTMILGALTGAFLGWLMGCLSLFLILLVLVQRGKGGGLTGALGGPGGQSAFGSKAGDTFTVITVVVATIWAFTCAFTMWLLGTHAPSVAVNETNLSAGPGDDAVETTNILIPGGADEDSGDADDVTPSMELTPAEMDSVIETEKEIDAIEEKTEAEVEAELETEAEESSSESEAAGDSEDSEKN